MEKPLAQLIDQAAAAPFTPALLEADPPLWGGFWQGDVIAPGYRLPASELALLRASRLDNDWPENTPVDQFLADLRAAISSPRAGVWSLRLAGEPCLIFAAETAKTGDLEATVVWYGLTTGCLHAGYRVPVAALHFEAAETLCPLPQPKPAVVLRPSPPEWLKHVVAHYDSLGGQPASVSLLDTAILRHRLALPPD